MRTLLIADDPIMAHALNRVLRQGGYDVRTARSAPAGLGQALSGTYALIMSWLIMANVAPAVHRAFSSDDLLDGTIPAYYEGLAMASA